MEDGGEKGKPGYYVRSYEGLNQGCDNKNLEGDIEIPCGPRMPWSCSLIMKFSS